MRLLVLIVALCIFGCLNQPAESRYEKIARAYCECTGQLATLNEKTAALAADTNAAASFAESLRQIQTEYVKAKECTAIIVSQFGKLKPAELDSVKHAFGDKCAHLAEQGDLLQEMLGE